MADRAHILLWSHTAFNRLPRHVRSLDVGGFSSDGSLVSVGNVDEFFILNEFVPGEGYYRDLEPLRDGADMQDQVLARVDALCDYLADIQPNICSRPSPHDAGENVDTAAGPTPMMFGHRLGPGRHQAREVALTFSMWSAR